MTLLAPFKSSVPAWSEANVWIVGASTGIGAATAKALLEAGAHVVLSARSRDQLVAVSAGFDSATVLPLDAPTIHTFASLHAGSAGLKGASHFIGAIPG